MQGHLFNQGFLPDALEGHGRDLDAEIDKAPEDHLLMADEDEWIDALVQRYWVETPQLRRDDWWMDPPVEVKIDVRGHPSRDIRDPSRPFLINGFRVVVHVPFDGEADVFKFRPSQFGLTWPVAEVRGGEVRVVVEYPADAPRDVKVEAEGLLGKIESYLGFARNDVDQFNRGLEQRARRAVQGRRERVRKTYEQLEETGIPMRRPDDAPRTYIEDVLVRRPSPTIPTSASQAIALEPVISDARFEHILEVIRDATAAMERSPKTYAGMGEEDRRQVLLTALNTHYRQATAEAFNVSGHTDILVRHPEGRNLFIGECKFWTGSKGFSETVDQLFRYAAWRDTKLAVVMFVRTKELTSVIEKGRTTLEAHPQFVEWGDASSEPELRATMSWRGDEKRHADLNVFFVHVPE